MILFRLRRLLACLTLGGLAGASLGTSHAALQPDGRAPVLTLDELEPGMSGEVWTVFSGTEPEPFTVKVTGVIRNSLGPGKSMILCELTDPRVQKMGAVAGMSGSPLYIDGRLAGALSYQVQRFETVRYAGFTPIADLREVQTLALSTGSPPGSGLEPDQNLPADHRDAPLPAPRSGMDRSPTPLATMFTMGGLSPQVAALFDERFAALGISTTTLGGSLTASDAAASEPDASLADLQPGDAVAAALAVGDITLAGTGTVSQVDGQRVLAFGHPLLGLGEVEVPMVSAEIVTILPSNLSSFKIANTGQIIGTVRQDRLSAIYGEIGPGPELVPVTVETPQRTLQFSAVRHPRLTPTIAAAGLSQAVLGSNDAGLSEGFSVATHVVFPDGQVLTSADLFAGPKGFNEGLNAFTQKLSLWLQNPVQEVFPREITFTVEPLPANPTASLDNVTLSRRQVEVGESFEVTLTLRDFQSQALRERVTVPVPATWAGKSLEVILAPGPVIDTLELGQDAFPVNQIRSFDAFINVLARQRRSDGLYLTVVERTAAFVDQTAITLELPGSLSRVARKADDARYRERGVREILWSTHVLPGRLVSTVERRYLKVGE